MAVDLGVVSPCTSGVRGQTPQVSGTGSYPMEWTSNGPGSNLEGGTTRGAGHAFGAANS